NILAHLLTAPLARGPYRDLDAFGAILPQCTFTLPVERALWAGLHADRLGYAFVGGYSAALARLLQRAAAPERPLAPRLSLCATEAAGAHPRNIATRLDEQGVASVLRGEKTFATLASAADELLVVA